jgi:hypothetical protein
VVNPFNGVINGSGGTTLHGWEYPGVLAAAWAM